MSNYLHEQPLKANKKSPSPYFRTKGSSWCHLSLHALHQSNALGMRASLPDNGRIPPDYWCQELARCWQRIVWLPCTTRQLSKQTYDVPWSWSSLWSDGNIANRCLSMFLHEVLAQISVLQGQLSNNQHLYLHQLALQTDWSRYTVRRSRSLEHAITGVISRFSSWLRL
jgi:hypothetical protein